MPVLLQNLVTALVSAAVADFGGLDYSTTAAGAVLDTLALISGSGDALGSESKVSHHLVDPWGVECCSGTLGILLKNVIYTCRGAQQTSTGYFEL